MPQTAISYVGGIATWLTKADAISAATPLVTQNESLLNLFLGNIGGSFGETSALLIILGGLYLIYKKSANWKIVVASIGSFLILQTIFWSAGLTVNPLYALLSGSFLLGAFFMITDPVSASQSTNLGRYIYGSLFGIFVVLIRTFSNWTEGVTFAILLANMFAPLIDYYIKDLRAKRRAKG
jgi:Na+-transporting NADH:ubiquinone oxidoreductase subunit B